MKRIISFLLVVSVFLTSFSFGSFASTEPPSLFAEAAVLIDSETGEVLFEKNKDKIMFPASTTKIMTGLLAIENGNFSDVVTVDDKSPFEIEGAHISLEPGEEITLEDLVNALLIESANDAAAVTARHISGSIEDFSTLMNKKAKEIGAKNTNFRNPHGLPDKEHTTTAYDLALIAKYAMKNDTFRSIVRKYKYTIPATNKKPERNYLHSENKLLYSSSKKIVVNGKNRPIKYEGAIGIKTGYTSAAGNCLVSSAKRDGRELIAVVLKSNGNNLWVDTHKLLDYGFSEFKMKRIAFKNEYVDNIKVESGTVPFATGVLAEELAVSVPRNVDVDITKKMVLAKVIEAPIYKGQVLGKMEYYSNDTLTGKVNIISAIDIDRAAEKDVIAEVTDSIVIKKWVLWAACGLIILRLLLSYLKMRKRRKRRSEINRAKRIKELRNSKNDSSNKVYRTKKPNQNQKPNRNSDSQNQKRRKKRPN